MVLMRHINCVERTWHDVYNKFLFRSTDLYIQSSFHSECLKYEHFYIHTNAHTERVG
jgi:hypothetical protein